MDKLWTIKSHIIFVKIYFAKCQLYESIFIAVKKFEISDSQYHSIFNFSLYLIHFNTFLYFFPIYDWLRE